MIIGLTGRRSLTALPRTEAYRPDEKWLESVEAEYHDLAFGNRDVHGVPMVQAGAGGRLGQRRAKGQPKGALIQACECAEGVDGAAAGPPPSQALDLSAIDDWGVLYYGSIARRQVG